MGILQHKSIFLILLFIFLFLILIKPVSAEWYYGEDDTEWKFWRWDEAIWIDENGNGKTWILMQIQFPEKNSLDRDCYIPLNIPTNEDVFIYSCEGNVSKFLSNSTNPSFITHSYSDIAVTINKTVSNVYRYYSIILCYNISDESIIFKKSGHFSSIDRWEINTAIDIPRSLFCNGSYPFVSIYFILPPKSSVTSVNKDVEILSKSIYDDDYHLDIFQKLPYSLWTSDSESHAYTYELPELSTFYFNMPSIQQVLLNYSDDYTPGEVIAEYTLENEEFLNFTKTSMDASIRSEWLGWISIGIAIISLVIAIVSVIIARSAHKDSKRYQTHLSSSLIHEKIAMMNAYCFEIDILLKKRKKGDLIYYFNRIENDLQSAQEVIMNLPKKGLKRYDNKISSLVSLAENLLMIINKHKRIKKDYSDSINRIIFIINQLKNEY